jgi:hypothetical protein
MTMTRSTWTLLAITAVAGATTAAAMAQTPAAAAPTSVTAAPAPMKAEVYVIAPRNGAHVTNPVTVRFGLKGAGIAPAGVKFDNTGHHHLLVDTDLADVKLDAPVPATDKILHFGKGQTETTLTLAPGKHTLQLLFADAAHMPFSPVIASEKITITVK